MDIRRVRHRLSHSARDAKAAVMYDPIRIALVMDDTGQQFIRALQLLSPTSDVWIQVYSSGH